MYLLICRNSIPGGSDGSGSFAADENHALEKISLTALAFTPQNKANTRHWMFYIRLDQLNKKNILSVTDTAQERARDHDQSIKMKNRKNTYPFFFTSK